MAAGQSSAHLNRAFDRWPSAARIALILIGMMLAIIAARPDGINHDSAQHLQTGQLILAGAVPFVDVYDTNPPLIMYLNVIPAGIARLLGAPVIPVFLLCVLALVLWSTGTTWRLLRSSASVPRDQIAAIPIAVLAVSLLTMCSDWQRLGDYGQREHLLVLLLTPFLVFRALNWLEWLPARRSSLTAVALGLGAGLAVCLKPHFLLVVVSCEVYWIFTRRRVRPLLGGEMAAVALTVMLYGVWLRWLMPAAAREGFWGTVLPMVREGYSAYNTPLGVLANPVHPVWVIALVAVAGLWMRPYRSDSPLQLVGPFSVATLSSLAVYVAQSKLWSYHLLPAIAWSAVILAVLYGDLRRRIVAEGSRLATGTQLTSTRGERVLLATALLAWATMAALLISAALRASGVLPFSLLLCLLLIGCYLDLRLQPGRPSSLHPCPAACGPPLRAALRYASGAVGMAVVGLLIGHLYPREPGPIETVIALHSRPGDRVLVLSTRVSDLYPALLRLERFHASRYFCAWPVAMFYHDSPPSMGSPYLYHRLASAPAAERVYLQGLGEDVGKYRPPLVLIRSRGPFQALPEGFNMLDYFQQSGFIARVMGGYVRRGTVADFAVFTLAGPT